MSAPQANDAEKNIEIWKIKKLIKRLEMARGNGTSMISLIIRSSPNMPLLRDRPPLTTQSYSAQRSGLPCCKDVG